MRVGKDFTVKFVRLNGHKVNAIIPTKTISLEEGVKIARKIFSKYR